MTMNQDQDRLCVKELASALQVSTRYVYQMRACGFKMSGTKHPDRTATVTEAVAWVQARNFRLCDGKGLVDPF